MVISVRYAPIICPGFNEPDKNRPGDLNNRPLKCSTESYISGNPQLLEYLLGGHRRLGSKPEPFLYRI